MYPMWQLMDACVRKYGLGGGHGGKEGEWVIWVLLRPAVALPIFGDGWVGGRGLYLVVVAVGGWELKEGGRVWVIWAGDAMRGRRIESNQSMDRSTISHVHTHAARPTGQGPGGLREARGDAGVERDDAQDSGGAELEEEGAVVPRVRGRTWPAWRSGRSWRSGAELAEWGGGDSDSDDYGGYF